jgi:hypothetical protein
VAFARERQAADGIATRIMEQVRGLAYSKIEQGMKTELLAADPYIESCSGTYRLRLPGTASCAGERIVSTSGLTSVYPLVPNTGTFAESDGYPTPYTWRTYVSNECPGVSATCPEPTPYRVTVYVSWASPGMSTVQNKIQTQSYFFSPEGCVSSSTHPFSAPCQPFFFGQGLMPSATINVEGQVQNLTFQSSSLYGTNAESTVQQEQVSQVQGKLTPTATALVDDDACEEPNCNGGASSSRTTAADADPSGATPTYSSASLAAGPLSSYTTSSLLGTSLTVANTAGDSGQSLSAVSATSTNVCPPSPPAPPTETDSLPCGGTKVTQAGTLRMTAVLNGVLLTNLGTTTVASIDAPAGTSTTFSNRTAISGQDGTLANTVVRRIGHTHIAGLPANFEPSDPDWDDSFIILDNYADTVTATAGSSAAAPSASITSGTLKVWNGSSYDTFDLTANGATGRDYSFGSYSESMTDTVDGQTVTAQLESTNGFAMASVPATTSTPSGGGSILRNEVQSTVGSPVFGSFLYTIKVGVVTVASFTIDVDLGTITAKAIYTQAPTTG